MTATGLNAVAFTTDISKAERQLLGTEQTTWLQGRLQANATWHVLGQQVLMGRMNIPAPLVLGQVTFSEYTRIGTKAATTGPASLTADEAAVLAQPAIAYNLDAWDGYPVARETVLGTAKALNRNLVVFAGDTHNGWANDLADMNGAAVGVEFAVSSVTSPGFEAYFPNENPAVVAAGLEQLIGPLVYANTKDRGYMAVTLTATEARADWIYTSDVLQKSYTVQTAAAKSLKVLPGAGNRKLVAV
jgi:alkaline phosphatase D